MDPDARIDPPRTARRPVHEKGVVHPDEVPKLAKGIPKDQGLLPGEGKPPEVGLPPEEGVPPDEGVPPEVGKLPGSDGQRMKGESGQVPRGAPGQMDPWADNPWAPGDDWEEGWAPPPPPEAAMEEEEDDFYMQHPNFMGADAPASEE